MGATREALIEALEAHKAVYGFLDEANRRDKEWEQLCTGDDECKTCPSRKRCDELNTDAAFHEAWEKAAMRARRLTEAALANL